eukprot:8585565-Alexandrium_andersonii.AAC.1
MSASLVGSEMCIRDSACAVPIGAAPLDEEEAPPGRGATAASVSTRACSCLLYTSDAADDM